MRRSQQRKQKTKEEKRRSHLDRSDLLIETPFFVHFKVTSRQRWDCFRFADQPTGTSDLTFSRLDECLGLISPVEIKVSRPIMLEFQVPFNMLLLTNNIYSKMEGS